MIMAYRLRRMRVYSHRGYHILQTPFGICEACDVKFVSVLLAQIGLHVERFKCRECLCIMDTDAFTTKASTVMYLLAL